MFMSQDDRLQTHNKQYQMSERPIKDTSMLRTHGQKLCNNIDVHWLTPVTDGKCEKLPVHDIYNSINIKTLTNKMILIGLHIC